MTEEMLVGITPGGDVRVKYGALDMTFDGSTARMLGSLLTAAAERVRLLPARDAAPVGGDLINAAPATAKMRW